MRMLRLAPAYHENQICETDGKLSQPPHGGGLLDSLAETGADLLLTKGIPWLDKKAVEMGRY